jgi:hypothetical protein
LARYVDYEPGKPVTAAPDVAWVLMEDVPYESVVDGDHAFHPDVDDHLLGGREQA